MIISIFTPHGGCPERCAFCDQGVSGGEPVAARAITRTIEAHLATGGAASEIAFYGGTFTALARPRQLLYLEAALPYLRDGRIGGVRVATRPDAILPDGGERWLARLRDEYRLGVVELGAQSWSPAVLSALGRSHSPDDTAAAVGALRRLGLQVGLHLMIGCPGEGNAAEYDARLARWVLDLKPDFVRIHPLLVLKDTPLADAWGRGELEPLGLEAAVERAAALVERFETAGIGVVRLGLQPNELLGASVVAGPFHPAFGDLVRGRLLRSKAVRLLRDRLGSESLRESVVELSTSERLAGRLKGPGGQNLEWLRQQFGLSRITLRVLKEPSSSYDEIEVRIHHIARPPERREIEPAQ
ncbi:MAG: radical SAM protein [Deltaproteobacteria bacterium]|nr:radical SAM protein [Deltaproteobacteria bacterium]